MIDNKKNHTLRVRLSRWSLIEQKALEMSIKEKRIIKATDIADAMLYKNINEISPADVDEAKESR